MKTLNRWILEQYWEWERQTGRANSISEFARQMGIKQATMFRYLQGDSEPTGKNLTILAQKLGYQAYVHAGLIPDDPALVATLDAWGEHSAAVQRIIQLASQLDDDQLTRLVQYLRQQTGE